MVNLKSLNRASAPRTQDSPVRIIQFGKGNFLRAFADWMVDIMNERSGFDASIQIVQTNSRDTDSRFSTQEGLYHIVVNGIHKGKPLRDIRLITAVKEVINPYEDYALFLKAAENIHLQFVISNTTEAGIAFDSADADPDMVPASFPGKLTAFLYRRYTHFEGDRSRGLTVLPCELIEKNGEQLREIVGRYIEHWKLGDAFRDWITTHNFFCNTLVDRIVPGFPKDRAAGVWQDTGYRDELIVSAEPYHLWVIEPVPTPGFSPEKLRISLPLEQAGFNVKFTSDLAPYRTSKVRILNGAHTSMVPVAYLSGFRTVKEAIDDPVIGTFVRETLREEIIPTLDLPEDELNQFAADVVERFQNPFIRHELMSIALNSVSKFQVRVLPSILEYFNRKNKLPMRLVRSLAALILFYRGAWRGEPIALKDSPEVLAFFKQAWSSADPSVVVREVLSNHTFWKQDLTTLEGFAAAVEENLRDLLKSG